MPATLAAAVGGVIQAAHTQWFFEGGDLAATISESLAVLEREIGSDPKTWPKDKKWRRSASTDAPVARRQRILGVGLVHRGDRGNRKPLSSRVSGVGRFSVVIQ